MELILQKEAIFFILIRKIIETGAPMSLKYKGIYLITFFVSSLSVTTNVLCKAIFFFVQILYEHVHVFHIFDILTQLL